MYVNYFWIKLENKVQVRRLFGVFWGAVSGSPQLLTFSIIPQCLMFQQNGSKYFFRKEIAFWTTGGESDIMCAKSPQLCPTLCDPMDCSPPGSSVHGILQTRILEWVSISYSREDTLN